MIMIVVSITKTLDRRAAVREVQSEPDADSVEVLRDVLQPAKRPQHHLQPRLGGFESEYLPHLTRYVASVLFRLRLTANFDRHAAADLCQDAGRENHHHQRDAGQRHH